MSAYDSGIEESHDSGIGLEQRSVRALTECMTVLDGDGDVYTVVSESGSEYTVDSREGRCTCPDARHNLDNNEQCKHERRVMYATGEKPIPSWVQKDAVDDLLGQHIDSQPAFAASDGGTTAVEPTHDRNDARPSDCDCDDAHGHIDLPCWPCYRDGFEQPARNE